MLLSTIVKLLAMLALAFDLSTVDALQLKMQSLFSIGLCKGRGGDDSDVESTGEAAKKEDGEEEEDDDEEEGSDEEEDQEEPQVVDITVDDARTVTHKQLEAKLAAVKGVEGKQVRVKVHDKATGLEVFEGIIKLVKTYGVAGAVGGLVYFWMYITHHGHPMGPSYASRSLGGALQAIPQKIHTKTETMWQEAISHEDAVAKIKDALNAHLFATAKEPGHVSSEETTVEEPVTQPVLTGTTTLRSMTPLYPSQ